MKKGMEQETPQTFEAFLEALARDRPEVLLAYDNDRYHRNGELPPLTAARLLVWKRKAVVSQFDLPYLVLDVQETPGKRKGVLGRVALQDHGAYLLLAPQSDLKEFQEIRRRWPATVQQDLRRTLEQEEDLS